LWAGLARLAQDFAMRSRRTGRIRGSITRELAGDAEAKSAETGLKSQNFNNFWTSPDFFPLIVDFNCVESRLVFEFDREN
jgi:very-short-patch-repair endonuclease